MQVIREGSEYLEESPKRVKGNPKDMAKKFMSTVSKQVKSNCQEFVQMNKNLAAVIKHNIKKLDESPESAREVQHHAPTEHPTSGSEPLKAPKYHLEEAEKPL